VIGDGDPREWGRRLPDGRWRVHPPWGPSQIHGDIGVEVDPAGFGRYCVVASFPADRLGARWLLTGTRFGRRRAGRLADQLTAEARQIMAAGQADEARP
jgi:hypothetical protein